MDKIYQAIKEEITNDPLNVGYAGKTDSEIAILLNEPTKRTRVEPFEETPPIARILAGINTSNIVTEQDVTGSKK